MSFFFLMFLFYVGDNIEFKYGVGYSHCMFIFVESVLESLFFVLDDVLIYPMF